MEARFRCALGRAGRRFRDVWQGALRPTPPIYDRICAILGGRPPEHFTYELFLDDKDGQKISKSKGNGLSMEEWLRYAVDREPGYFMYQKPKTAKRLLST
jgi:lysyl-tRNA synthetase class I